MLVLRGSIGRCRGAKSQIVDGFCGGFAFRHSGGTPKPKNFQPHQRITAARDLGL